MNYNPILIVAGENNNIFLEIFFKFQKRYKIINPVILISSSKLLIMQMKKLRIKTSCGLKKHKKLKMNRTVLGKLRFYWFNFFAILRDLNK